MKRAVFSSESEVSDNEKNTDIDGEDNSLKTVVEVIQPLNPSCDLQNKSNVSPPIYQPPVRKASKLKVKSIVSSRVPYTKGDDYFLKKGLKVYGFGKWTNMLRDARFKFHEKRTGDSIKKRAELITRK